MTAVPLLTTVAGGFTVVYLTVPRADWVAPDPALFASLGAGVLGALAVSLTTWPLIESMTRHESTRFE